MKKYELTDESIDCFGKILYRIKAYKDFGLNNKLIILHGGAL